MLSYNSTTGRFEGKGTSGTVYVTATHKTTLRSVTFTAYIVEFDEGTYFFQNRQTEKYMQPDNDDVSENYTSSGVILEQMTFDGEDYQRWNLSFVGSGYYSIENDRSGYAITVPSGKEENDNTNLILSTYTGTPNQKWDITKTENGSYKVKAWSAKNYLTSDLVLAVEVENVDDLLDHLNIQQNDYVDNDSYKDGWYIDTMLPTSGYEIAYNPSNWGTSPNCYSYALNYNNAKLEPGYSIRDSEYLTPSEIVQSTILQYIEADSNHSGFTFENIGRYDVCPNGTYKIALVIDNNKDIHFYRQNPDGYWSHKRGESSPTLLDANGSIIFDPQRASRAYGTWIEGVFNLDVNYDVFVGYYYVTPLE